MSVIIESIVKKRKDGRDHSNKAAGRVLRGLKDLQISFFDGNFGAVLERYKSVGQSSCLKALMDYYLPKERLIALSRLCKS